VRRAIGSSSPVAETESPGDAAVPRELPSPGGVSPDAPHRAKQRQSKRTLMGERLEARRQALMAELGGAKAN
jgi:hypothetical protein